MDRFLQLVYGGLARNTVLVMLWQAVKIFCLTLWLIVIARQLGPNGYGIFSGVSGLATAVGGFSGLGLGLLMMQETSRQSSSFGLHWHKALRALLVSGAIFSALFVLIATQSSESSLSAAAIFAIGLSELLFFPMATLSAFAFAAHERMSWAAAMPAMMAGARLIAALCYSQLPIQQSLEHYLWLHAGASAITGGISLLITQRVLKPAPSKARIKKQDLREGLGFSAVWAVGNAYSSLDKTLVLQLTGSVTAGLYASAYRLASVFTQPIDALTSAAMARLFRRGGGDSKHPRLLRQLVLASMSYAAFAAIVLWAAADLLPLLLGPDFAPAVSATRWMALFLPCYGLRTLGSNILMASGEKRIRLAIEVIGLLALLLFATWWLPRFGLMGAVMMIIATEITLASLTWIAIWRIPNRASVP